MTSFPGRFLLILVFSLVLLPSGPAQAGWPRILVLPPVAATEMDRKIKDEFQWDLIDRITKFRYFDCVTQRDYESYLLERNMAGISTIPDSVLMKMMKDLQADLFAQPTLSQPGGEGTAFSARVTYIYPKDHYTKDDYALESEWYSEENEQKSWYLAGEYVDVIFHSRELIAAMLKARHSYKKVNIGKPKRKEAIRWFMDNARKDYLKLVEMEPENRTFNYMVGMCLINARRYDKAIVQFSHILANIDPEHVPTHETLANHYYYTSNDYEGALRHYSKLAEIDPLRYTYTHYWALSLDRLKRHDEAIEVYEKLIGIEDKDADVRHQMAEYYFNKDDGLNEEQAELLIRKAAEYMVRACEISNSANNPADSAWVTGHCQKLNFLAMLQHELDDTEQEIATLREIVELDPAFPGACHNLGIYAHKARDFKEAIDYYVMAVDCAEDAGKAQIYFQIGIINLQNFKDYPRAITALTAALETNDMYMKEMAHYFRATACLEYARELDYASDEVADLDALIASGTMSHARADRALELYTRALADLREISTSDPRMVRSSQLHVSIITAMRERLAGIKRQIDYNKKETFEKCGYTLRGLFFRFFREFQTTLPKACL